MIGTEYYNDSSSSSDSATSLTTINFAMVAGKESIATPETEDSISDSLVHGKSIVGLSNLFSVSCWAYHHVPETVLLNLSNDSDYDDLPNLDG